MRTIITVLTALAVGLLGFGCGDDGSGADAGNNGPGNNGPPIEPVELDPSDFTYVLEESTDELTMWTTPPTRRVRSGDSPPEETGSGLHMSAARGEYEPVQLLLGPGSGDVTVSVADFPNLSSAQNLSVERAQFEDGWPDELRGAGGGVALAANRSTPIWITVFVPDVAAPGEHETVVTVTPPSGPAIDVPLTLYVFDFSIVAERHYATQMNVDVGSLVGDGDVDDAKDLLWGLRFTPKSVSWPSGFNPSITWDNARSSNQCNVFWDEPDEPDQYSVGWLSRRYVLGQGWNGIGFPTSMLFQFVDNSTPRPATFCGLDRGDHYGSDAYNAEWSEFLGGLEGYLRENDMLDRGYWYVQNEPQNDEDHRLAAHLCRLSKAAAPDLRIAISEEPKPEIAEDGAGCGYDIWIAHVRAYQQGYAWQRQREFGEEVWLYSLDQDPDPYFNPTRPDRQGIHARIIPWVSWAVRATGFAYYDANRWFSGRRPTITGALLREGFEDYEYLWLANGGRYPEPDRDAAVDPAVRGVASSLTSWTKEVDALMALRHELGRFIEGSRDTLPTLEVDSDVRPRQTWRINFQDPAGRPNADPLVIQGDEWLKVGWQPYDAELGYGWSGEFIDDPGIALYGFDDVDGYRGHEKSYIYDDYGRDNLFEFAIENGRYNVTIGVGRPSRGYPGDPHNATIEGIKVVDDEVTTDAEPTIERTVEIDLADGSLSLVAGGRSESTGNFAYTFLQYLVIEPIE